MNLQLSKETESKAKKAFFVALISLTMGAFTIGMAEFVIMGLLPIIADDLSISISKAGLLISGYALGVAIGGPLMAIFTYRLPRKKMLCGLMVTFIIGNLLAIVAPNYSTLMFARIVSSLSHGTFLGVGSLIAASLVPREKKASAIATVTAGLTVANIIGVPLGTFIGQHFGWEATFGVIALLGVVTLIGIVLLGSGSLHRPQ